MTSFIWSTSDENMAECCHVTVRKLAQIQRQELKSETPA